MQSGERRGTLTAQLIRRTVLLSVIAVIAIVAASLASLVAVYVSAQRNMDAEGADAALEFDLFLIEIESDLAVVANTLSELETVDSDFRAALARHNELFDMRLIDPEGDVLVQRRRGAVMGEEVVVQQPWLDTVRGGKIFVSSVDFQEFGVPFVVVALPVLDDGGEFANTLVARLDLTALWQRVIAIHVGEQGYAYIVDADGQLLVYSDLELVRQGLNTVSLLNVHPDEINEGGPLGFGLLNVYTGLSDELVVGSSAPLESAPWYAVVEQPVNEALAGFFVMAAILSVILVVTILIVVTLVFLIRRRVAQPLRNITAGVQAFAGGDLSYRIDPRGAQLELLDLANTLNDMSQELEQINRTLEARVEARTRDIQLALEVSEQVSTILDPDVLLPQIADLMKETFALYHAHIYLLDDSRESLVLRAGAGEVGWLMRQRGHRIPVKAELSLVARAVRERKPVIVENTAKERGFLPNPLLPNTRSEAAVPLVVGNRAVGVLDVQSEHIARFDADTMSVLSTLAGQIAVAINNATLFSETERTARHEQALGTVARAIDSATNLDEVLRVATRELGKALGVPKTVIQLQLEGDDSALSDPQPVE